MLQTYKHEDEDVETKIKLTTPMGASVLIKRLMLKVRILFSSCVNTIKKGCEGKFLKKISASCCTSAETKCGGKNERDEERGDT